MNKPKVLIVSRRLERNNKPVNWVSEAHLSLLMKHNLIPVIVPIVKETIDLIPDYMHNMNGLLMVEGGDVSPEYYTTDTQAQELEEIDKIKDHIEITIFKTAIEKKVPVLGICRGLQIINAIHGGTLKNQTKSEESHILHINYDNYDAHRHKISIEKGTPLHNWYKTDSLMVNTYHHQGIDKLATDFKPMAFAEDGLIEAIYHPEHEFLVGLQFHPERMLNDYVGNKVVFESFARAINNFYSSNIE